MIRCCSTSQATRSAFGGRQAEPRAEPTRDLGAGERVILRPALGDVVQKSGEIERGAVGDLVRMISLASGMILDEPARLDRR